MQKKTDIKRFQAACATGFLLFLILIAVKEKMLITKDYEGIGFMNYQADLLLEYIVFSAAICLLVLWKGKIANSRLEKIAAVVTLLVMPCVSFFMFEATAGNFKTVIAGNMQLVRMNLYIWYILYGIVFLLINRVRLTILLMNSFTYILAVANAFVIQFREQPIMPTDFQSLSTAASVAGEFEYDFSAEMIVMGVLFVAVILWTVKFDFKWQNWKVRSGYALLTVGCTAYVFSGMLIGDWFEKAGATTMNFFRFTVTYANEGYMASTMKSIRFLNIEEPEGYSAALVEEMADKVIKSDKVQKELPENVIVIMNESFADLSVLGDFETSEPVMPFFDSLEGENVKKGSMYASVYGGGTANTEFEFLTGNSIAFIPNGVVAYQMYVEEGDSSIVSKFKENGYRTVAFHPYRKENYRRPDVYNWYGFDEYLALKDVKVKRVRKYPSDKSDYKNVIKLYEEKAPGEKLFVFNITIQNHGGYDFEKFKSTISLTEYPGQYPQAEQYLSLIKKSDNALKYLIEYFSQVEEKTVILFFGDHQPSLEDGFKELLFGQTEEADVLVNTQKEHTVPYLLWSNYALDIEEKKNISANYLGSYLLDSIGIELPVYNQYLMNLQEKIPALNMYGYLDFDGNLHWIGEGGTEYSDLIYEYRMFQYNNLFDSRNRLTELYE